METFSNVFTSGRPRRGNIPPPGRRGNIHQMFPRRGRRQGRGNILGAGATGQHSKKCFPVPTFLKMLPRRPRALRRNIFPFSVSGFLCISEPSANGGWNRKITIYFPFFPFFHFHAFVRALPHPGHGSPGLQPSPRLARQSAWALGIQRFRSSAGP